MKVQQFLNQIAKHDDRPLLFEYDNGKVVHGGYHVTEIKNASYETIDCGNSLHTWKEVVVQVWVPEEVQEGEAWMSAGKFTKIWNVVGSRIPLHGDAEIRVEYGDAETMTVSYAVADLTESEQGLVVKLAPPITQCKPRAILADLNGVLGGSCCTPAAQPVRDETVVPLAMAASCC